MLSIPSFQYPVLEPYAHSFSICFFIQLLASKCPLRRRRRRRKKSCTDQRIHVWVTTRPHSPSAQLGLSTFNHMWSTPTTLMLASPCLWHAKEVSTRPSVAEICWTSMALCRWDWRCGFVFLFIQVLSGSIYKISYPKG